MELNYLREFVVLAQTGNFMEAAEKLYISQSALSKHINVIEKELGVTLFDRTTRKVTISKYGQLLFPYAQQISELQNQYTAILQSSLETNRETLNLGTIPPLAEYRITDILVEFKKSRTKSIVNVMQGGSDELREMLRYKKCELAFIRDFQQVDDDLVKVPYLIDTMVAVLPPGHPLGNKRNIPLKMLKDESFLLIEKQSMPYDLSILACKQSGFEPNVVYTDHKLSNLIDLVFKGMGVALLMKPLALHVSSPKIAIVDITPSISTEINLCYLKGNVLSEAAKHFIKCTDNQREKFGPLNMV